MVWCSVEDNLFQDSETDGVLRSRKPDIGSYKVNTYLI